VCQPGPPAHTPAPQALTAVDVHVALCAGDEGVQALADALTSSTPGPKRVRIANNSAGPDALKDLAAAQKQNTRRHTRPTSRRPPPFILSTAAPTPLTAGLPGAPVQAPGQQQLGWGQQQPASGGKPAVAGGTARAAAGNTCPQPSPGDKSSVEGFFPGVLDCLSASEAEEEGRGGHAAPAWTQNSSTAGQQATEPSCSVLGQQRQQQVVPGVGSSLLHTPPSGALVPQSSSGRASFRQQQVLQQQDEDVRQLCALVSAGVHMVMLHWCSNLTDTLTHSHTHTHANIPPREHGNHTSPCSMCLHHLSSLSRYPPPADKAAGAASYT
jgi:hypothetical protein